MPYCWFCRALAHFILTRSSMEDNRVSHEKSHLQKLLPSKHVYVGPIWAESGHLSHSSPTWAPYRLFYPYKTHICPILVKFGQQTCIYGNPYEQILGIYPIYPKWALYRLFCPYETHTGRILIKFDNYKNKF